MWQTIRYRRLQAVTIALLAALVTTCAVFAPLYSRAMQQAITRVELQRATVANRGVVLSETSNTESFGGADAIELPGPDDLLTEVPAGIRRYTGAPLLSYSADATYVPPGQVKSLGQVLWRSHECEHLRFVQGRCPSQAGEIAVSTADARLLHLAAGTAVEVPAQTADPAFPPARLRVVGVYRQRPSADWFGVRLTGSAGVASGDSQAHDVWVTARSTFGSGTVSALPDPTISASLPVAPGRLGVDQLLALGRTVGRWERRIELSRAGDPLRVSSRLPTIAAEVRHQGRQSQQTVPLLMLQLALLAVVVLWLVLGSATEQRRPEVAVAVLRGRGQTGARGLLLRELLPVVLVGAPVGAALALGLCWVARTWLLPGSAPFEVGPPAGAALLVSAAALVLTTALAAQQVTREPVERLLRRVPVRRTGWRMGVVEALVVAAAGASVVAFVTGSLTGPVALIAPALLALFVGVLLSHATAPLAAAAGRRLLRRGRVGAGMSMLDAARTPASRRTIAVVTVASALLGYAMSAVVVGARNRTAAAGQEAGAPVTAQVLGTDVAGLRRALDDVDPSGRRVTPVVSAFPPSAPGTRTMAVDPRGFGSIALFGSQPPDLTRLHPSGAAPLRVRGRQLSITLTVAKLERISTANSKEDPPASLDLDLLYPGGDVGRLSLGSLADAVAEPRQISSPVSCASGCSLVGVTVETLPSAAVSASVTLSDLAIDHQPVAIGPGTRWTPVRTSGGRLSPSQSSQGSPTSLDVAVQTTGAAVTTMNQAWLPTSLPAIVTSGQPSVATGLDASDHAVRLVGRLPRVPGGSPRTTLVDLDLASRATSADPGDVVQVWFAHDDPTLVSRVRSALGREGMRLGEPTTLATVRTHYDESTAAWSLGLGVVVGVAALLLAMLVVVVLAVTTWRTRARDLAALRLAGVGAATTRRVATLAQLPALVVAVVGGTACGALGTALTLGDVPLFASAPAVSTLDLSLPWPTVVGVALAALVVLSVVGLWTGSAIARRAVLQRVRETL